MNIPTSLIREAIAKRSHMSSNGGPFSTADDANVLNGQDSKEQILISPVIPILVVHAGDLILRARG